MDVSAQNLAALNSFLRGEISATEIYRYTLERVNRPKWRLCLDDCMQSHARRTQLLRHRIDALGGIPARGSGTWGVFVMSLALGADMLGPLSAIAALELGETHGRLAYLRKLHLLDPATRAFIEAQVLPAQNLTHEWINALKRISGVEYLADR